MSDNETIKETLETSESENSLSEPEVETKSEEPKVEKMQVQIEVGAGRVGVAGATRKARSSPAC